MSEIKKARVVYIKEHFLLLAKKDLVKALLLDRLVFYYQQNEQAYGLLEEEAKEGVKHQLDFTARGWVKKSASFLADSLLVGESDRTIQRKLDELFHLGYIDRKRNVGEAYWYRPNMKQVIENLKKLGYDLEGSPVKGGADESNETQEETSHTNQRMEFAQIPSVPERTPEQTRAGEQKLKESQNWAAKYPCLDNAPPDVREVSKTIFEQTGFEPRKGEKDKDWISAVTALWGATGKDKGVLLEAIDEGNKKRFDVNKPLTFSGPRSYISYANDVISRRNLRKNGQTPARIKVGQTTNGTNHNPSRREKIKIGIQTL